MKRVQIKSLSLLWRILLSTSIALTALFALAGWMVESYVQRVGERSLEEQVRTSLQAYQALWATRANTLAAISRVVSSMADVRAAFMTGDQATIRDTAEQLWSNVSAFDAAFLVLDPTGKLIASLGGSDLDLAVTGAYIERAAQRFPHQVSGYLRRGAHVYYVVLTPVYVEAGGGPALLNVLAAAFDIDENLAKPLQGSTNGSDFALVSGDEVITSSLPVAQARDLLAVNRPNNGLQRLRLHGSEYVALDTQLADIDNRPIGTLYIIRSFRGPQQAMAALQRNVFLIWLLTIAVGLGLTYLLARRILEPVKRLDHAAGEVIKRRYDYRVPVESDDELGRLAQTFNTMCDSIRSAREDLIRQERIATIGRLATSIVHDLRNPLAAIYGGAEMLVDTDLSVEQSKRLASNIYKASRRIKELLQELVDVARSATRPAASCHLGDILHAASERVASDAAGQSVSIAIDVPNDVDVIVDRDRLIRVFLNLINNALDAMPNGGKLDIRARREDQSVIILVDDTGPGLSSEVWATLFQPFASFGKKNGLGIGLALARQTVLEHGGDLWAERSAAPGARFCVRLPLAAGPGLAASNVEAGRGALAT